MTAITAKTAIIDSLLSYTLLWSMFCKAGTGLLRVSYVMYRVITGHNRPAAAANEDQSRVNMATSAITANSAVTAIDD